MRSIWFRVFEPMMFRGASEFTPSVLGPQSIALSKPLPPPSTIAGTLATLVLEQTGMPPPQHKAADWHLEVLKVLGGQESTLLKGPFLVVQDVEKSKRLHAQYRNSVLPLSVITESLSRDELLSVRDALNKVARKFELGYVDQIGIKVHNDKKIAEEGMIYTARMVDYNKIGKSKHIGISIAIEVLKASRRLQEALSGPKTVRFGGQGRLAEVKGCNIQLVDDEIKEIAQTTNKIRLYLVSPILFEAAHNLISKEEVSHEDATAFIYTGMQNRLRLSLEEIGITADDVKTAGSVGILGGFSVAKPIRKPIYASLQSGSIIELTRAQSYNSKDFTVIYNNGLGLFRELGYGTVIPVPT